MTRGVLLVTLILQVALSAGAEPLTLRQAVERAGRTSPLVAELDLDRAGAELVRREVEVQAWLPQAHLRLHGGVVPEARGDVLGSPDETDDLDGLGPWWKGELLLIQPLHSFGRHGAALKAAESGIRAREVRAAAVRSALTVQVVEALSGLQAAREGLELARELRADYRRLLGEADRALEADDPRVDDGDLLEVRSAALEVERGFLSGRDRLESARDGLRLLLGLEPAEPLEPEPLIEPAWGLPPEELEARLPELVARHRDLAALDAALEALEFREEAARRESRPILYLAGGYQYAQADNRDDQTNPFVSDEFNYSRLGAELGMQLDLGLVRHRLEWRKARLETERFRRRRDLLARRLELELRRELRDAHRAWELLEIARSAHRAARSWSRTEADAWDLGLGEPRELVRATRRRYELGAEEIRARHDYRTALGELARGMGAVERVLDWFEEGTVGAE